MIHPDLFPHSNGVPNYAAHGRYALCYKHPSDLHLTLIFNWVTLDFIREYLRTRKWCREAHDSGWTFYSGPAFDTGGQVQ